MRYIHIQSVSSLLKVRQQKEEGQLLHLALLRFLNLDFFFCSFLRMATQEMFYVPAEAQLVEFRVYLTCILIVCERHCSKNEAREY